jgi:hypothetical protein
MEDDLTHEEFVHWVAYVRLMDKARANRGPF